ncbi:MAG TPA: DUF2085 domain-containing protein [Candidatus Bilamarchaeaceae archaeon]|nr:DUF2085 domain-containing protein [Candidatus Bilamarchaeaceae archaeon]
MQKHLVIYTLFILAMFILNVAIWATPLLAFDGDPLAGTLYHNIFVYFCHQKISRSLCLFEGPDGFFIADCIPQQGGYVNDNLRQVSIIQEGVLGYKFPVCARDISIYLGMLLAGLAYARFYRLDNKEFPDPLYLIIALIPIGVDGGLQLLSGFGFDLPFIGMYESTNLKRIVTGFIAGAVIPFYILPILNRFFGKRQKIKKEAKK